MDAGLQWSSGAGFLWNRLREKVGGGEEVGLNQVLLFLVENYPDLVKQACLAPGLDRLGEQARTALGSGDRGVGVTLEKLSSPASRWAASRGKDRLYERDLIATVLELAGLPVRPMAEPGAPPSPPAVSSALGSDTRGQAPASVPGPGGEGKSAPAAGAVWRPTAAAPTLELLGRDLTALAACGEVAPIVGRDLELELVVETLCRPSKPNPLLLGPAGVGKTAIVEALAQRVVTGRVPVPLQHVRVFAIQTSDLVQGMGVVGELEKRMRQVVEEAEQRGVIVFLDEVHTVIGAGAGGRSTNDVANILKPALGRGRMLCIGATTDGEYARHLAGDAAFERRFQVVRVQELDPAATRAALAVRAASVGRKAGVEVEAEALDAVIALSSRYLRHRRFPDKAIDILDQSVARAVVLGLGRCNADLVREVVARVVGLPVTPEERDFRLARLASGIVERAGIWIEDAERLVRRLRVTMANLDLHPGRPNAVVAVPDPGRAARLAQVLAEVLLGDGARVVEEDFSSYSHPADVSRLIGAAPGYVGHDEAIRLHLVLRQQPWSVVLLRAVDCAHPAVQTVIAKALSEGALRDAHGEETSWADSICVLGLAATGAGGASPRVGFLSPGARALLQEERPDLDPTLAACVDLVCGQAAPGGALTPHWVRVELLEPLERRVVGETGGRLDWAPGFAEWVAGRAEQLGLEAAALERWFEEQVVAGVAAAAGASIPTKPLRVEPGADGGVLVTEATPGDAAEAAPAPSDIR